MVQGVKNQNKFLKSQPYSRILIIITQNLQILKDEKCFLTAKAKSLVVKMKL